MGLKSIGLAPELVVPRLVLSHVVVFISTLEFRRSRGSVVQVRWVVRVQRWYMKLRRRSGPKAKCHSQRQSLLDSNQRLPRRGIFSARRRDWWFFVFLLHFFLVARAATQSSCLSVLPAACCRSRERTPRRTGKTYLALYFSNIKQLSGELCVNRCEFYNYCAINTSLCPIACAIFCIAADTLAGILGECCVLNVATIGLASLRKVCLGQHNRSAQLPRTADRALLQGGELVLGDNANVVSGQTFRVLRTDNSAFIWSVALPARGRARRSRSQMQLR